MRQRIEPLVKKRQEIGRIDIQIDGMRRQQGELDQRASETRANLEALKRDNAAAAAALRKRLGERLEQFTKDGDKVGRDLVELQSKRLEKKIEIDDLMRNFEFTPPPVQKAKDTPPAKK
jgi:chromosome segregation ATPase